MFGEHVYRYPRWLTWCIEIVSGALVGWSAFNLMRTVLLLLWQRWPLDAFLVRRFEPLAQLARYLKRTGPDQLSMQVLLWPLGLLSLALLVALVARNMFPVLRVHSRGILVGFGNDWVPVHWENLRALRITETEASSRFAVFVETTTPDLTAWHSIYGLLYRLRMQRGFLITSLIEDADGALRTIMDEIERRGKLGEKLRVKLDDSSSSLLFSPFVKLGAGRTPTAPVFQPVATTATMNNAAALVMPSVIAATPAAAAPTIATQPSKAKAAPALAQANAILGQYPRWVVYLLNGVLATILLLSLWRYLSAWATFLIFVAPNLRETGLFRSVEVVRLVSPWGFLLAAHLAVAIVVAALLLLRALFPAIAVDDTGVICTVLGRSHRITWEQISFVKATDVRRERHVVLVEAAGRTLPWYYIAGSWLYDGGTGRGALIWPMISNFEPIMQRVAVELTRRQDPEQPARLRDDVPGWLLQLIFRPADALDQLVISSTIDDDMPANFDMGAALRAGKLMLWVAAAPAFILLLYWMMYKGQVLYVQVPIMFALAIVWGMTEWPLASFLASSLDQVMGAGNKAYQGFYLYPHAQFPRLLLLLGAILLTLMGFPTLALLAWLAAIAWSGLLTAGCWEALYGWRGLVLLLGSLLTIVFQLLTLIGVVVLRG